MSVSPSHFGVIDFTFPSPGAGVTTPTLSVNSDGTVATISGSSGTSTNTLSVTSLRAYYGSLTWSTAGTRTGNGTINLSLSSGRYLGIVASALDGFTAYSNLVAFQVGSGNNELLHSPADILRWLLIGLGDLTDPADNGVWPGYAFSEPNSPDEVVTLYDTEGQQDGRIHYSGEQPEHYGVSLRVRSTTGKIGYAKMVDLMSALSEQVYEDTVTVDSATYLVHSASRRGSVNALNKEQGTRRSIFVTNWLVSLKRLS